MQKDVLLAEPKECCHLFPNDISFSALAAWLKHQDHTFDNYYKDLFMQNNTNIN